MKSSKAQFHARVHRLPELQLAPHRLVLEGVPQVKFYDGGPRCPEDICLPSVLRAVTEYLNDPDYGCSKRLCAGSGGSRPPAAAAVCRTDCSYAFFVGVTGAAWAISWKDGWHEDNQAPFYLDADPLSMEKHAFAALGWSFQVLGADQREKLVPRITESLERGMPVISYGVFGPPEAGLICGIDDDGDTILGWNFFSAMEPGVQTEPSGYYRRRDWKERIQSLLVIGEKGERPSLKATYRAALELGLRVTRTTMVRPEADAPECYQHRHNGLAAYDAWADHLLRDDDFPQGSEAALQQRFSVHNGMVGSVAEARWYGSQFLVGMAGHVDTQVHRDAVEDILHAAALYAGDHALMWNLWDLAGGLGNPEGWKLLADPSVRRRMIPLVRRARENDERAAVHQERALARWH